MEAWLSSSVTDARIASLDCMRTQLSTRGWRFQEKITLRAFYEQKLTNGRGGGSPATARQLARLLARGRSAAGRRAGISRPVGPTVRLAGWPAGRPGRRPAQAERSGWLAGRPAQLCGRLPTTKNRLRTIKTSTVQMVPKYLYNAPMSAKMRSNNIIMHFYACDDILRASRQGELL